MEKTTGPATNLDRIPRYAYNGGFRVAITPGEKVNIRIVGMAFEARETSEIAHEEYDFTWENIPKVKAAMRLSNLDFVSSKIIDRKNYCYSAKSRLDFLVDSKFPLDLVLDYLKLDKYRKVDRGAEEKILNLIFANEENFKKAYIIYGELIGDHVKSWGHPANTPTYWH